MSNAISSFGTLLKIGDGAGTETFTTIAEVLDIDGPTLTQDTVEVTSQTATARHKEYIVTLKDGGEVTFDVNYVTTDGTHNPTTGLIKDYKDGTLRNFQIIFSDSGTTTWTIPAFVVSFGTTMPVNGALGAAITLKVSGEPTLS